VLGSSDTLVPIGQCHSDFSFYNILDDNKQLFVIDWEMYKTNECVIVDIMKLLTSFCLSYKVTHYKKHHNYFQYGFIKENRLSTFFRYSLDKYLALLGFALPSELRSALLIYSIVLLSVVEAKRKGEMHDFQPYILKAIDNSGIESLENIRL
jgi:thiamine kinase-like enzyme